MILEITKDTALIGAAGVHFVASELSLRGLIALPTIRNTAGMNIVVMRPGGDWHASIQVKTSRSKVGFWPIGANFEIVAWMSTTTTCLSATWQPRRFEAFLESSEQVIVAMTVDWLMNGRADSKNGHPVGTCRRMRRNWRRAEPMA